VVVCIHLGKFRTKREYLRRVVYPQQNDYQATCRTIARCSPAATEAEPDQEPAFLFPSKREVNLSLGGEVPIANDRLNRELWCGVGTAARIAAGTESFDEVGLPNLDGTVVTL
jgi:hypothetical protein